jgi:hypothetical protein
LLRTEVAIYILINPNKVVLLIDPNKVVSNYSNKLHKHNLKILKNPKHPDIIHADSLSLGNKLIHVQLAYEHQN